MRKNTGLNYRCLFLSAPLFLLSAFLLSACNSASLADANTSRGNRVTASSSATSYTVAVHGAQDITVYFTTTSGTASNLSITSSLPSGWSIKIPLDCAQVTTSPSSCSIVYTYAPTSASASAIFSLSYQYTTDQGSTLSGNYNIVYTAEAYAYVIDDGTSGDSLYVCAISSTGALTGCSETLTNLNDPSTVGFNGRYIYVAAKGAAAISYYSINSDGSLAASAQTTGTFSGPSDIVFNGSTAYVINNTGTTVSYCSVSNGALTNCAASSSNVYYGQFMTLNGSIAYITAANSLTGNVYFCAVNNDGSLGTCNITRINFDLPLGIAFYNNLAYVADMNHETVYACTLDNTGNFIACSQSTTAFNSPSDIAFYNGYAYVVNHTTNPSVSSGVFYCSISGSSLTNCQATGVGSSSSSVFTNPYSIAFSD